jgi:hypothetical protein
LVASCSDRHSSLLFIYRFDIPPETLKEFVMFSRRLAALFAVLILGEMAGGQTGPQLLTVFPNGAKTGESVEVTLTGIGFDGDEKLLFSAKGFKAESLGVTTLAPDPKVKLPAMRALGGSSVKFKVTVPKEVPLGTHDVRVVSKSGLSNPRAFVVGDLAEVNEIEPNNDVGQAQKIALNTTVNGVISTPIDVDYVTFKATAGQNIVVSCLTSSIDSKLTADLLVSSSDGRTLATNHGYRGGDALLDFKAPADGDYLVRVAQFAYTTGGPDHFYRLTVTTGPWVDVVFPPVANHLQTLFGRNLPGARSDSVFKRPDGRPFDALSKSPGASAGSAFGLIANGVIPPSSGNLDGRDDPEHPTGCLVLDRQVGPCIIDLDDNSTIEKAQAVKVPCDIAGRIARKNDRHWYSFEARKGDVWTIEVFAERIGSPMTPYFVVADEKGKTIARIEDSPESLSPNQFYTKCDDPARYRFIAASDGTYKIMVSSVEAAFQSSVRDQYLLRIAPERPDFHLAVMPVTPHLTDAGTLPKKGAALFSVFAFRSDGFNDAISLTAANLPTGVICPPQVIGVGQTRGTLVLVADAEAKDWDGFVSIVGTSGALKREARPFTVTWSAQGLQPNQPPPNTPMITRLDRGPGMALAIRGDAPFSLTPVEKELKGKPGEKLELTLKITRNEKFKDGIQLFFATPNFGPRQQGNNLPQPLTTIAADKTEVKVSVDIPQNLASGNYTLVLRGQSAAPAPKAATVRPVPTYPTVPVSIAIQGKEPIRKK